MVEHVIRANAENPGDDLGFEPRAKIFTRGLKPLRLFAGEFFFLGLAVVTYGAVMGGEYLLSVIG